MRPTIDRSGTTRRHRSSASSPPKRTVTSSGLEERRHDRLPSAPTVTGAVSSSPGSPAPPVVARACVGGRADRCTIWCIAPRSSRARPIAPSPNSTVGSSSHAPRGARSPAAGRSRRKRPASSAPAIERTPHVTTTASHSDPDEHRELARCRAVAVGREQRAADPGDERAQAEHDQLRPHDADAERGRRGVRSNASRRAPVRSSSA